jgi:hypothetical protein
MRRRARTHQLIELGVLVHMAGLVALTGDDRDAILGGMLGLADAVTGAHRAEILMLWRRRGRRAFAAVARSLAAVSDAAP